jgi:flagellar hook-associated protein 1 FlgK
MADMMSSGLSSLRALQRALDTTSNNIANANTEGYSRQLVEFRERQSSQLGNGYVGNGVEVATIRRAYDEYLGIQARSSGAALDRLNAYAEQAQRVNNLFGDSATGLSASMQRFANAVQGVATTPASMPARQTLLAEGSQLVERLRSYDSRLRELESDINTRFATEARDITALARSIAQLNAEVSSAYERTGQPPNQLLDQRDGLVDQLAKKINVTVSRENGYTLNVFIGNGQALVLGTSASEVATTPDSFEPERAQLALRTSSGLVDITSSVAGGALNRSMLHTVRVSISRARWAVTSSRWVVWPRSVRLTTPGPARSP